MKLMQSSRLTKRLQAQTLSSSIFWAAAAAAAPVGTLWAVFCILICSKLSTCSRQMGHLDVCLRSSCTASHSMGHTFHTIRSITRQQKEAGSTDQRLLRQRHQLSGVDQLSGGGPNQRSL